MPNTSERTNLNRTRAESFGALAERYDRARPGYPPALIDDLVAAHPADALDIGTGTGKAARLLAERGVRVIGVEIDDRMADVARAHGITVETGGLEDWRPAGRTFDLVTCAQAWHWLEPAVATATVAQVLRPGGLLALFWNFVTFDEDTQQALDAAYTEAAPELSRQSVLRGGGPATLPQLTAELAASEEFTDVVQRGYPWDQDYTREDWLELIGSHSDHSTLPPEQLAALLQRVGQAVDSLGGVLHAHYVAHAVLAHRAGGPLLQTLPEIAEALGVPITKVHQHLRDGQLVAIRNATGARAVPALFVRDGAIVKSLPGVITLLRDVRYSDEEIVDWLHRADDTLPGTPIQALRDNRGTEVKRRAQAAGF